jgi:hypothetical protein
MSDIQNPELQKYILQGRVDEELDKEVGVALELPKKEETKVNYDGKVVLDENQIKLSVLKSIVESMTANECMNGPCGPGDDQTDPKVKSSRALTQTISDALWKISDFDRKGSDLDDLNVEIQKELKMSYNKVLRLAVKKLYDIWYGGDEEEKEPETAQVSLQIVPNEQVSSPTGEILKIEEVLGDKVKLQKFSGEFVLADIDIVKKWAAAKKPEPKAETK